MKHRFHFPPPTFFNMLAVRRVFSICCRKFISDQINSDTVQWEVYGTHNSTPIWPRSVKDVHAHPTVFSEISKVNLPLVSVSYSYIPFMKQRLTQPSFRVQKSCFKRKV